MRATLSTAVTEPRGDDTLRGTTYTDFIYGRGGNDTLVGYSGGGSLSGQDGNDTLLGGRNPDGLHGGRGNDTLDGGDHGDGYGFDTKCWGKDRIIDTLEPGSGEFDDNSVGFNGRSGGVIVNLASDSGPIPEVRSKSDDSSTVNWDGDFIDDVSDSSGDDTINGNSATNHIYAFDGGTDTISTGDGDDLIYVTTHDQDDESEGDIVECGEGNDTVHRDPPDPATGDPGDVISADCENQLGPL